MSKKWTDSLSESIGPNRLLVHHDNKHKFTLLYYLVDITDNYNYTAILLSFHHNQLSRSINRMPQIQNFDVDVDKTLRNEIYEKLHAHYQ